MKIIDKIKNFMKGKTKEPNFNLNDIQKIVEESIKKAMPQQAPTQNKMDLRLDYIK